MKKLPIVSIIVPTYNNEDTIEACLLSLIGQTYPAKEIIVTNDKGSTDRTEQILTSMAEKFPSILRVISTKHMGRSEARNLGWKNARGEILFFVEADGIYNEDHLDKAVKCLSSNPRFGGVTVTGAPWKTESTCVMECIDIKNRIQRKLLDEGKIALSWAWIYHKEAVEAVDGFDERMSQAEDKDLFLRVKRAGYSFGLVTGVNWYHKGRGRERLVTYMKKCFLGGKRRVLYMFKHRNVTELSKRIILPWACCLILLISIFFSQLLYAILVGTTLFLFYKMVTSLKLGWNCVENKNFLFLLPIFSIFTYLATTLGYNYGTIIVAFKKIAGKSIDWSSI